MKITEKLLILPIGMVRKIYRLGYAAGFDARSQDKKFDWSSLEGLTEFMNERESKKHFSVLEMNMSLEKDDDHHYYSQPIE